MRLQLRWWLSWWQFLGMLRYLQFGLWQKEIKPNKYLYKNILGSSSLVIMERTRIFSIQGKPGIWSRMIRFSSEANHLLLIKLNHILEWICLFSLYVGLQEPRAFTLAHGLVLFPVTPGNGGWISPEEETLNKNEVPCEGPTWQVTNWICWQK